MQEDGLLQKIWLWLSVSYWQYGTLGHRNTESPRQHDATGPRKGKDSHRSSLPRLANHHRLAQLLWTDVRLPDLVVLLDPRRSDILRLVLGH